MPDFGFVDESGEDRHAPAHDSDIDFDSAEWGVSYERSDKEGSSQDNELVDKVPG